MNINRIPWENAADSVNIKAGHILSKPSLLFEKIEDHQVEFQIEKLHNSKSTNKFTAQKLNDQKPNISFDDFSKMDIRTGTVLEAEKVPKTKKLLKLLVDTGIDKRIVVSGIAEFYKPENIIGQQVVILLNLEPRKIKGIQSQGMILMAENTDGTLNFIAPPEEMNNGAEVK